MFRQERERMRPTSSPNILIETQEKNRISLPRAESKQLGQVERKIDEIVVRPLLSTLLYRAFRSANKCCYLLNSECGERKSGHCSVDSRR